MKKLLTLLGIMLSLVATLPVLAQDAPVIIVQGKITDKQKAALTGVTVAEVDAEQRTVRAVTTDVEGAFAMRINNKKNKLSFSFIGYKTLTLGINDRKEFNLVLESNSADLGEVVIVSQRKTENGNVAIAEKDLTTAVARISAKDLEEMQAASIDQALQGRLSGVDITASSGDPGAGMQIRIRGTSSINGSNNPMIVVDGMPYETQIPSDFNFGTADELGYASLLNIAPTDIRDITILKDAAATAIWGSRAANGVLLITTKRGAIGRPTITYNFKGSMMRQPEAIPMLNGNQYSTLVPEAFMNRNGMPLNTQTVKEFQYDPNDPYWFYNYSNNTDWVREISQTGFSQDHTVAMNGGGERAKYYASVGMLNQRGTTIGTGLNRLNTRINLDYEVSDRIKIRTDLSFSHTDNNRNYVNSSNNADGIRNIAYNKMPNMSVYEYDEFGNRTPNFFSPAINIQGQYAGTYNPVAMALAAKNNILNDRVTPRFNLQYQIIPEVLLATADVQFDINNTKTKTFLPQNATGRPYTETVVNRAYDGDLDVFNVTSKTNFVYTPKFKDKKHNLISYLSLFTFDNKTASHEALSSNTASSLLQDPSIPSRTQNQELRLVANQTQTRNIAATLSAQYSLKDRYIVNLGIRGEGHSRFGPGHRYGSFPSLSARYRISDEPFMAVFRKVINDLSLRASYGQSGNAPRRDYTFYNTYNNFDWGYAGQAAVYPANMELKNLRWETIIGQNFGFNLAMFKSKLNVDVEIYKNKTKDLFFANPGLQISSFTGFNTVDMNVGTMDNQGWELSLNATPYQNKKLKWTLNFNIARNINMIREISEFYPREQGNLTANGQYKTYMQVNNPFGSFYGFRYEGVYSTTESTVATDAKGQPIVGPNGQKVYMRFNYPNVDYQFQAGDAKYADINKDGNINYMDIVYLGNSNPQLTGGFGSSLSFKNTWTLTCFFNYRYKYDVVNGTKMQTTNMFGYSNQSTAVLRRWRKEGDVTDIPRALFGSGYNWLGSDRYVEDASFLRFRTLTLRYNMPRAVAGKLKLKNMSAFVTGENLFTWTNYTGQDPEVSMRGNDPFRVAIDYSMTPPVKTVTIGLTGSF
ncbi:TonB-linked outer membrane protein, SusC/RagA family [Cnuella takakiae]|uniref:TonB-linked outer membrane protein, SusC/RagA family n=1 Tax=Cnuella takakiae TaxID=1302690 RepID=A0A1M4UR22_9BACT|nr:SusC/RagA family TonB-linked outer membrane protein [Cnuella takakiae]OLY92798.1 SusC/RagA family TonB-linked outer membrane protein [Cnuella takakiae]SHE59139.1 TonB-linked outer membrane protein, SusC/RagA family [Cnuella takakiae]